LFTFHAADNASGSSNSGTNGNYWSASYDGSNALNLNFNSGNLNTNPNNPAHGFSVRLFREESVTRPGGAL
jgi:hypothetical protein